MSARGIQRYIRPIEEVRKLMLERAGGPRPRNPFEVTDYQEVERAFASLSSLDRDAWAEAFSRPARPDEERAAQAEAAGDSASAKAHYLRAANYYRVARYPAPNSPGKRQAYERCKETYLKAAKYFDPPLERIELPFRGRPGEGRVVVGYLRRPPGREPKEVVVIWGGIDSYKEEQRADGYLARNLAVLAIDMPGAGEAPIVGSEDAERLWGAVFDWIAGRPDLDARRVGLVGRSTGGYWATKLAHTHRDRIRAAVNHGGCVHDAFTPEWIEKAQHGEYPLELAETLAFVFGRATFEEWVEYAPRLSLLTQGILDQPSAPLLCVNGMNDSIFPISDHYLLLEHGQPKSARFYPVGHMGFTPETEPMIINWVATKLDT